MVDVTGCADNDALDFVWHAIASGAVHTVAQSKIFESRNEAVKEVLGNYLAALISSTMAWVAARGSGAARMGRPTTRKSAPARMASPGVAVRAWSSFVPALRLPESLASRGRTP